MDYIIPGYIKIEEKNLNIYLTNEYTGRIVQLDLKYKNEIIKIINNEDFDNKSELFEFLVSNEMLIESSKFEEKVNGYTLSEKETLSIVIFATEQCNFRCKYCYEKFRHGKMEDIQYDLIYEFIENKINSGEFKYLCINWFGGEPLLQYENVANFNARIKKLSYKNNIELYSNITTNGYMLTKEVFDSLYNSGIKKYQITIDGSYHDTLRTHANGSKTKEIIEKNIKSVLSDKDKDFLIIIRNNILKGNEDYAWYDEIVEKFGRDSRITIRVHLVSPLGGNNDLDMMLEKTDLNNAISSHCDYIRKIGLKVFDDFIETPICYAALPHNFSFRPNGQIVTCTVDLDDERNIVGKFDENGLHNYEQKSKRWSDKFNYKKCKICRNFLKCEMNICPSKKGNEKYCNYIGQFVMGHDYV